MWFSLSLPFDRLIVIMFHTHLLILILLPLTSTIFFDVKRYAADPKDGNEPYRPVNYFVNKQKKRSICLFMYCWDHHGNCKSISDCCECKCRNSTTYFSERKGCKEGHDMSKLTNEVGKACYFATTKFGFDYVPLFHDQSRFVDIELDLPRHNFQLNDKRTSCNVGAIHDHDYHGHKLLYDRNHCSELFHVLEKQGKQYLRFLSTNVSIWNSFRGRLLSLDIDCNSHSSNQMFSSCFLFQVEGKYRKEVDGNEPPEIPPGYACPTVKNTAQKTFPLRIIETTLASTSTNKPTTSTTTSTTTTTLRSTSSSTTLQHTTTAHITTQTTELVTTIRSTKLPTTTIRSTTHPFVMKPPNVRKMTTKLFAEEKQTPASTKVTVIFVDAKDTLTGTTIGVLTGLGTGLAIVMICVIIWILVKKRTDIFKTRSVNTPGYHYDVPNINVQPTGVVPECGLPNGHTSFNFVPVDDDRSSSGYSRQYSYIGEKEGMDEVDFESRENTILIRGRGSSKKNADMSNRPLPENSGLNRQYSYIGEKENMNEQDIGRRENTILLRREGSKKSDICMQPLPENTGYGRQYSYIGGRGDTDDKDFESRENSLNKRKRDSTRSADRKRDSTRSGDMSKRPLPENAGYGRQYSYIGEKVDTVDLDEGDFESRDNTLKSRGSSKIGGDMSKRPLPEKPMESVNQYYSVASLTSENSDKASEGNDLYSLYSTIDDLKVS